MFLMLYHGKDSDSWTGLTYLKYMKIDSSSRTVRLDSFPPAEQAAYVLCITGIFSTSRL